VTQGSGIPRICLSLTADTLERDLEVLQRYRSLVDLVELRADFLRPEQLPGLRHFPRRAELPVILTVRRERDGGRWRASERDRSRCLESALKGGYAYVELEEDLADQSPAEAARAGGGKVIRSFYDLHEVPGDLVERVRRLPRHPTELPKAAVTARDTRDLVVFARSCRQLESRPCILLGMGERGLFSRVLAGRLGSELTYCSAPELTPAAPGHLDPRRLVELYRFRSLDRATRVCGVIGRPIAHSRSPEVHNRGYAAIGLNAVYLPFLVDQIEEFFTLADLLGVHGLSVTMPFKQSVIPFLRDQDPRVAEIDACNTMVRGAEGWYGTNTDVEGFLDPLRSRAPEVLAVPAPAAVLGAGGAARSVVYALSQAGVPTLVLNRTPEKAAALAERFSCAWGGLDDAGMDRLEQFNGLIVQATGAGMEPQGEIDPLPAYHFRGTEVLYELIYEPAETPIVARARKAGCRIISGFSMLLAQARNQFRLHTGCDYPEGLYD
jgi:3-dehydroquinate dehydratase/shikimate dehydrogenase